MGIKKDLFVELMKHTVNVKPIVSSMTNYIWFIIYISLLSFCLSVMPTVSTMFQILIIVVIATHLIQNTMHYFSSLRGFFFIGGIIAVGVAFGLSGNYIMYSMSWVIGCSVAYLFNEIIIIMKRD